MPTVFQPALVVGKIGFTAVKAGMTKIVMPDFTTAMAVERFSKRILTTASPSTF